MKKALVSIVMGCALAFSAASHAAGDMSNMDMSGAAMQGAGVKNSMSHGEIKKVDTAAGKLTIKHGPLENLGMEAMTMVFKVKDPAMLSQVKVGDKIDFVAEEVNGALTVVKLQKQ
ncbi:TPA: copper-binding protein [Burkholderia contaminans]|uniref:copper-binding protein n=1 Tax=Burkholderia cepacia complex TaxID=87882 RepID=UPI00075DD37E|nr:MULTISPECIES: copper-binding protein [Burkholderia cepacia complex]KVS22058.1 RND transporter [Burkholderia vietnamiensis]MBM6430572.1 copper-binding protein [Burkholderia contaminans]MCA7880845.1 copper-binding protein [Burkholderia contaminans]MCB4349251.1 copper-binding protein [Burkholderia vietnamiensis]MDN8025831.1 copper-binding protein [Burkholderia contaminans]